MIYLLVALEMELSKTMAETKTMPESLKIRYTGVGKVNAAIVAAGVCAQADCTQVINYGTAGSLNAAMASQLVRVAQIHQRDMDARPLAALGVTPFEDDGGMIDLGGEGVSLSTGDNFVTAPPEVKSDIVDMEAYAIAKACRAAGKPFSCYKYITDLADADATRNWRDNVASGAALFLAKLLDIIDG